MRLRNLLRCMSQQLARKRRSRMSAFAPLVEEERTSFNRVKNDANDPYATSADRNFCNANSRLNPHSTIRNSLL
jgi:hypothetical protein